MKRLAFGGSAVLSAAAVAIVVFGGTSSQGAAPEPPASSVLAVLRGGGVPVPDAQAPAVQASFPADVAAEAGPVFIARSDPASQVVIKETVQGVCIGVSEKASSNNSAACTTPASAKDAAHPMVNTTLLDAGRYRVTALLIDGISSVVLTDVGGTAKTVDVTNNIANTVLTHAPSSMRWTLPNGRPASMHVSS